MPGLAPGAAGAGALLSKPAWQQQQQQQQGRPQSPGATLAFGSVAMPHVQQQQAAAVTRAADCVDMRPGEFVNARAAYLQWSSTQQVKTIKVAACIVPWDQPIYDMWTFPAQGHKKNAILKHLQQW